MNSSIIEITADPRTRYPMVTFPSIRIAVGLLPLTWVQLEYFLAETFDRRFDAIWYQNMTNLTKRIGSGQVIQPSEIPRLFVRGFTLQEVQLIGRWWGGDQFIIPTVELWQKIQSAALKQSAINISETNTIPPLLSRSVLAAKAVDSAVSTSQTEITLADQMLFRNGLRELAMLEHNNGLVVAVGDPSRAVEAFKDNLILKLDEGNRSRQLVTMRLFLRLDPTPI